jgi:hypothetical protein
VRLRIFQWGRIPITALAGFDTYKLLSIMRITNLGALFVCAAPHTSFASVSDLIE